MADVHASMVNNPYHYSFQLCASALNSQTDSVYSNYLKDPTKDEFHCDQCDRSFKNSITLKAHIKEHVVCNTNGCKFTAHPKIIQAHIRMQHRSGIFNMIKKLNNPEEIKKWLADRKRKYPTQSNIAKKAKLETEKRSRGERIEPNKERFNKNFNNKSGKRKRKVRNKKHPDENKPATVKETLNKEVESKRNGALPEFSGTGSMREEVNAFECSKFFYLSEEEETKVNKPISSENVQLINKSLSLLMTAYDSGEESEENTVVTPSVDIRTKPCNPVVESDDEPPEEIKNKTSTPDTASDGIKRFPKHLNKGPKKSLKNNDRTVNVRRRKPTLLQKLLEEQVVHERTVMLECIHYIVNNNFLRQADDETASISEPPKTSSNDSISKADLVVPSQNISKVDKKPTNKNNFLLQGLLKDEIIQEHNKVLQCIRYITKNNFLQDVK